MKAFANFSSLRSLLGQLMLIIMEPPPSLFVTTSNHAQINSMKKAPLCHSRPRLYSLVRQFTMTSAKRKTSEPTGESFSSSCDVLIFYEGNYQRLEKWVGGERREVEWERESIVTNHVQWLRTAQLFPNEAKTLPQANNVFWHETFYCNQLVR